MAIIAISPGHNAYTGARSWNGKDEWTHNAQVCDYLYSILTDRGHTVRKLARDKALKYTAAMRKLGREMARMGADLALELHFNSSAKPSSNGYEYLHWWRSKKSKKLAQCLGKSQANHFPGIKQRGTNSGARSLWFHRWNERKAYSGRGGAYCYLTPCPAVICEMGFASNKGDWSQLENSAYMQALSLADGIEYYLKLS